MAITHEQYQEAIETIKAYQAQLCAEFEQLKDSRNRLNIEVSALMIDKSKMLDDCGLSVRITNILSDFFKHKYQIRLYTTPISFLESISYSEVKKLRNWGAKSEKELFELCVKAGIKMLP